MVDFQLIFEVDSRVDFERWSEPALTNNHAAHSDRPDSAVDSCSHVVP